MSYTIDEITAGAGTSPAPARVVYFNSTCSRVLANYNSSCASIAWTSVTRASLDRENVASPYKRPSCPLAFRWIVLFIEKLPKVRSADCGAVDRSPCGASRVSTGPCSLGGASHAVALNGFTHTIASL